MAALRVALLVLALWALRRELTGLGARDLARQLGAYGAWHALLGLGLTLGSFLTLGITEWVAMRYAGLARAVPRRVALVTGAVANAMSQAIGVALLTGAAIRLRAYRRYAVDAGDVARLTGFVTLTVTLGLLATAAVAFMTSADPLHLWGASLPVRAVGALFATLVIAYLAWSHLGTRAAIGRGAWQVTRPELRIAVAQLGLAALDWIITGSLLHLVMGASLDVPYATTLRVYLIAQTVGMLSHVPGGAGVFELMVLTLLGSVVTAAQRPAVVASLVMFRVLYYVVPLAVASIVAAVAELRSATRTRRLVADAC